MKNCSRYLLLLFVLILGCSKEDESTGIGDSFYNGADSSASIDDLKGVWAIFSAEFEGKRTEVPINYSECGREFFVYSENGTYTEYIYQSSACDLIINTLDWELSNGILTLSNSLGQKDDLVITRLNSQEFNFKTRFDVDEDGELDIVLLIAKRYEPEETDLVSGTFTMNTDEAFDNLLSFTWKAYDGFNNFDRYEIYRSAGENCTKANAELIATISDASVTEFTDLTAPGVSKLCYFIKIYTDKGLLGESVYYDVAPSSFIRMDPVALQVPTVVGDQIELNWEPSDSPYFSHYEVTVSNYPGGTGASGAQEYTLGTFNDINVTSFTDENPPYLENPIYAVYAHNIFGNKSPLSNEDVIGFWEVSYKRKEVIGVRKILSLDFDPEEPVVYIYGELSGNGLTGVNIRRFNYSTSETESISDLDPGSQTSIPIKVFNSPSNGKELVIQQGIELHFYNANTLEFKYAIDPEVVFAINDFIYDAELDIWLIADGDDVFTLKRDNTNLSLVDSAPHFPNHQGSSLYKLFALEDNRILLGHFNEPNSIVYTLDNNGAFLSNQTVDIGIRGINNERTIYNNQANYMLDTAENRLYSTNTFEFLESFEFPSFPSGTSIDGAEIFGTNNDPTWSITQESLHKKEAVIYDRNSGLSQKVESLGYPHILFESNNGAIISISTGFKKETVYQNINGKADIFIETLIYLRL